MRAAKDRFSKLIEVKSLVTFALIATLCYLAVRGRVVISEEFFAAIVTSVVTYFFTRRPNDESKR